MLVHPFVEQVVRAVGNLLWCRPAWHDVDAAKQRPPSLDVTGSRPGLCAGTSCGSLGQHTRTQVRSYLGLCMAPDRGESARPIQTTCTSTSTDVLVHVHVHVACRVTLVARRQGSSTRHEPQQLADASTVRAYLRWRVFVARAECSTSVT